MYDLILAYKVFFHKSLRGYPGSRTSAVCLAAMIARLIRQKKKTSSTSDRKW